MLQRVFVIFLFSSVMASCGPDPLPHSETPVTKSKRPATDTSPFVNFEFDKVYAFASVSPFVYPQLYGKGKMDLSQFHDTINRLLDSTQVQYLSTILDGKLNTDSGYRVGADCFYPRHNIIFIKGHDSVLHYVSVCFECGNIVGSKFSKGSLENFAGFFNSIGLKVFEWPDQHKQYYDSLLHLKGRKKGSKHS